MIVFARLLKLKFHELVSQPFILLLLLVFPVVLGSIAGTANTLNSRNHIDLAVVDQDRSAASQKLIDYLLDAGWHLGVVDEWTAEQRLIRQEVDGILMIQEGFAAAVGRIDTPRLLYREAEGSMMTALAREVIAAAVMPLTFRKLMLNNLDRIYGQNQAEPPADLAGRFDQAVEQVMLQNTLGLTYVGDMRVTPVLTAVVSDYSMEVFFLSIYAVLGSMALSKAALRQRLSATRKGLRLDYAATLASLQLLGMVQILFYNLSMNWLMRQPFNGHSIAILTIFLFFMLGLGQLLSLIEESLRLYLSLLIILLSAVLGGCFFQVSYRLMIRYGQYGPHGWALMAIRRAESLPAWLVILLGVLLILIGYYAQKKRARTDLSL